ncbi:MAG: protein kinase [Labilithrix sp.]|nr:protein kinase [Labilithrix sp.]
MASPPRRASGPYRPTRLGQWEVVAKIAGGGMSAVYLGRRVEPEPDPDFPYTPRPGFAGAAPASDKSHVVALKIVRHDAAKDERLVKMFLEEGKLLARLVHPGIVRTLEVGGDAEQDFIAMELMLGKTFAAIYDALVTRGLRLSPELAAWVSARIADALHYAHELADEHGRPLALVHRDVNPANVFATFKGEVKLFDFGLAKVTAGEASGSQMLAGKLSYLSPEQIMQMPLDRRSDVFSLGTTFWELLTSRRLFRRDSDIETVRAVQLGPIPDPRAVAPEVPEELARIARTALERNRDHRYPSTAYLARELDAFVLTRTTPDDVTARLAELVDTLFPGEQKRQSGWLKPAITSSISRSMSAVATTPRPGSVSRPMPPEVRRDTRETTIVMAEPPGAPPASGAPPSWREDPTSATVKDGVPAIGAPPVSSSRGGATSTRSAPPPTPQTSRPAPRARIPTPAPFSRTEIQTIPPAPDSSRTEIQHMAPTLEVPAAGFPSARSAPPPPPSARAAPPPARTAPPSSRADRAATAAHDAASSTVGADRPAGARAVASGPRELPDPRSRSGRRATAPPAGAGSAPLTRPDRLGPAAATGQLASARRRPARQRAHADRHAPSAWPKALLRSIPTAELRHATRRHLRGCRGMMCADTGHVPPTTRKNQGHVARRTRARLLNVGRGLEASERTSRRPNPRSKGLRGSTA